MVTPSTYELKMATMNLSSSTETNIETDKYEAVKKAAGPNRTELQRRIFKDLGGGPLILDPWFCSYFRGKQQANLHMALFS